MRYEDCISAKEYANQRDALYKESVYVGYRYYESAEVKVRFPFGYGLSYTTFSYDHLQVQPLADGMYQVICDVTNTGNIAGKEVVQAYVAAVNSNIFRPAKELKAFAKIDLEPGQTKQVAFVLNERSFAIYLGKTYMDAMDAGQVLAEGWYVPKGRYNIMIGSSSQKIELMQTISVDGMELKSPKWQKDSWYETLVGEPQQTTFEKIVGYSYTCKQHHKGEFTMEDTVEEMKNESFVMKLMYNASAMVIKKGVGGKITEDNEADYRMMLSSSVGSPLRSMMISSGMKSGLFYGLLDMANGHFFRGLGKIIGIAK